MIKSEILNFDTKKYNFRQYVQNLFNLSDLEKLHKSFDFDTENIKPISKDTHSSPHKIFYKKLDDGWKDFVSLYNQFIKDFVLKTLSKDEILFQTFPNLRISFPENVAVSTWHKDTDNENLHPKGEINFFLPLTRSFDTNTIWIESETNKKDFKPINVDNGQVFMFSGGELTHGNQINKTKVTRVSFDFRVLPLENYNPLHPFKTRTKNLAFKPGGYYSKISL